MEVPPPYAPAPRKSNTGLIVGLVIGGILLCCVAPIALLAGGGYYIFGKAKTMVQCGMAFENVRDGILDYAKDHDGKLPKAETWMDDVRPYYAKSISDTTKKEAREIFQPMPAESVWGCDNGDGGQTGMAFNKDLSGKSLASIKDQASTYVIFELEHSAKNLAAKYEELPRSSSPKFMGKPRGWFKAPLEGDVRGAGNSRWRTGSNGALKVETSKDEPAKDKPAKADDGGDSK